MLIIELDATDWTTGRDFYRSLIAAIGLPDHYSGNYDAVMEALIWDYDPLDKTDHNKNNAVNPPYTIHIRNTAKVVKELYDEIQLVVQSLPKIREEFRMQSGYDVDVNIEILS